MRRVWWYGVFWESEELSCSCGPNPLHLYLLNMSTTSHWNPLHVFFVIVEGWEVWLPRTRRRAPSMMIRCKLIESYSFWIIWVLNHTRFESYPFESYPGSIWWIRGSLIGRRETVRLTRPGISPAGPAGVFSWILLKKSVLLKRVYY